MLNENKLKEKTKVFLELLCFGRTIVTATLFHDLNEPFDAYVKHSANKINFNQWLQKFIRNGLVS